MFYTPGWGAVMTLGGTLGGVLITSVANRSSARRQEAEKIRLQLLDIANDVADAQAALHENKLHTAQARQTYKAYQADKAAGAETGGQGATDAFNLQMLAAEQRINFFKHALRRAELAFVDDPILQSDLREIGKAFAQHQLLIESILELLRTAKSPDTAADAADGLLKELAVRTLIFHQDAKKNLRPRRGARGTIRYWRLQCRLWWRNWRTRKKTADDGIH